MRLVISFLFLYHILSNNTSWHKKRVSRKNLETLDLLGAEVLFELME